jgi:hypothetical protein
VSGIVNIDTLLFNVRLSVRYHNRRRAFFDTFNLAANAFSVIFSSAAIAALRADSERFAVWSAIAITIISGFNLVLRTSERARQHHDLAKRFIALEQKVVPATDDTFSALYGEKLAIEADEPPPLNVLALVCHNDQIQAEGIDVKRKIKLRWWQRLFAHLADLPPDPLPPSKPHSEGVS